MVNSFVITDYRTLNMHRSLGATWQRAETLACPTRTPTIGKCNSAANATVNAGNDRHPTNVFICKTNTWKQFASCVTWGFRRGLYEIFDLLCCYAALSRYRRFGTTYRYNIQGSSSPCRLVNSLRHFQEALCLHLESSSPGKWATEKNEYFWWLFRPEDAGTPLLPNVGNYYQSTRRNIPEDLNLHQPRCQNLKSGNVSCSIVSFFPGTT